MALRAKFRPVRPNSIDGRGLPGGAVGSHPLRYSHYGEMQRLFAGDCNRRPAAIAAAINDDIYGAGWQDWVPFGVWLCEEYPLLLRSARVQGRRDQCRLAAEVVRESVGVL